MATHGPSARTSSIPSFPEQLPNWRPGRREEFQRLSQKLLSFVNLKQNTGTTIDHSTFCMALERAAWIFRLILQVGIRSARWPIPVAGYGTSNEHRCSTRLWHVYVTTPAAVS